MRADERSRARGRRDLAGLVAGAAAVTMVTGLTACKPNVDISIDQNRFDQVVSVGAVSTPAQCLGLEDDLSPVLRFALLDQRLDVIQPGAEQIVGYTLELNENFTVDSLFFEGQPRIFPSPDIPCTGLAVGSQCPVPEYAAAGFTCQELADGVTDVTEPVCALNATVNVDTNRQLEFIDANNTDVVLLSAAGNSLFGIDPCGSVDTAWRSDPTGLRVQGFVSAANEIVNGPNGDLVDFCASSFREAGTLNLLDGGGTPADCFVPLGDGTQSLNQIQPRIDDLRLVELDRGTNNYLQALDELFEIYQGLGRNRDLHVVLFTDGDLAREDVLENDARAITYASVVADAQAIGATIHVQQLDNRPPQGRGIPAGNLVDLQGLACQTGGTHSYVQDPQSVPGYLLTLGRMMPSHYRAQVNVGGLSQLPIGAYKIEAVLGATVDGVRDAFAFSAGGTIATTTTDTRFSVYNRGTCDPAAAGGANACQPGMACDAGTCVPDYGSLETIFPSAVITDEDIIDCVEDATGECTVLDVANLPNDQRVTDCIDAAGNP